MADPTPGCTERVVTQALTIRYTSYGALVCPCHNLDADRNADANASSR
jgi:ferredoxin-thioredoxin reductase catalytic subunit